MKIKYMPEVERPMEKAINYGIDTLSNAELIALLIHTGTKSKSAIELANEIISVNDDGLLFLGECTYEDLCKLDGIGKSKATSILAAIEIGKRLATMPRRDKEVLDSADKVANLFMEEMRYFKKEFFKSLLLNVKGNLISIENISIGELSSTVVHPREVFSAAIRKSAAGIIFIHNHPSGDSTPSNEDIDTTKRLNQCGELLGIKVLDHIIIGDGEFSSLKSLELF